MKTSRRRFVAVNAGSMADIAFLLLIFFLVTTTISAEKGILRKLPKECPPDSNCHTQMNERNILRISINANQDLMVGNDIVKLNEIKNQVSAFVDNNGSLTCDYCNGRQRSEASDHPKKAVISLSYDTATTYDVFIAVQDEITKAFYELRSNYGKRVFNKLPAQFTDSEIKQAKRAYPFILSEVQAHKSTE